MRKLICIAIALTGIPTLAVAAPGALDVGTVGPFGLACLCLIAWAAAGRWALRGK